MTKFSANAVLVITVAMPVVLFALLSAAGLPLRIAVLVAVVLGWSLSISWARTASPGARSGNEGERAATVKVAVRFGWICPAVLVGLTWAAWSLALRWHG